MFGRFTVEDALEYFNQNKVKNAEVFLESFCEYNKDFGQFLAQKKGEVDIHSIHTLTTQFEPTLYSLNKRAQIDSFKLLEGTLACAEQIGAKYYTFHGVARIKRTPMTINFDRVGEITNRIIELCSNYGLELAYENVHWCYYNYVGFFKELKKHSPLVKATLDVKQARQSGVDYKELLSEMSSDIVTVHLSDVDKDGKMCLPGKGTFDFDQLFSRLCDVGFNGCALIEAYQGDYKNTDEILESLNYLQTVKEKYFR
jgi:sugar phosphate isomerase/epimerase